MLTFDPNFQRDVQLTPEEAEVQKAGFSSHSGGRWRPGQHWFGGDLWLYWWEVLCGAHDWLLHEVSIGWSSSWKDCSWCHQLHSEALASDLWCTSSVGGWSRPWVHQLGLWGILLGALYTALALWSWSTMAEWNLWKSWWNFEGATGFDRDGQGHDS